MGRNTIFPIERLIAFFFHSIFKMSVFPKLISRIPTGFFFFGVGVRGVAPFIWECRGPRPP